MTHRKCNTKQTICIDFEICSHACATPVFVIFVGGSRVARAKGEEGACSDDPSSDSGSDLRDKENYPIA